MILICNHCGIVLIEGDNTINTQCTHYSIKQIQQIQKQIDIIMKQKTREIELPLPKNKKLPKEMDCPSCPATINYPDYVCKICNSQVIFIETNN